MKLSVEQMQLRRTTGGLASDGNDEDGTLHETNILPLENRPLEKEIPIGNQHC